jgi:hypothetical protein
MSAFYFDNCIKKRLHILQKIYTKKYNSKSIHIFLLKAYQILCFLYYCKVKKIGYIKEFIGNILLSYKVKRHVRVVQAHNLDSAKTVGIIFDASEQNTEKHVVDCINTLIKKHDVTVEAIGFISNKKKLEAVPTDENIVYFSKHDFTWYGVPKSNFLQTFISKKFDVLLNISIHSSYPFEYITQLSNADFRIGTYTDIIKNHDLMINIKKEKTIDYLITQILVYLSMIQVSKV